METLSIQQPTDTREFDKTQDTIKLLGRKWTIPIIRELHNSSKGKLGFMELRNRLDITPKILSERLKQLKEYEMISKKIHEGRYTTVDYRLTPVGGRVWNTVNDFRKIGRTV
ncbi:MAG: hypothetical protein GF334_13895 [Candidatus Altiarchaeales archaeon]|nr:hypothetical protein [Candidatus Altiarchaeales archaeon]